MKFQNIHRDDAILAELGSRLTQYRIRLNLSQAELAEKAGVGKRTLERLEAGETTQTRTLFRVLRELELLTQLDALLPEPTPGPRDIVEHPRTLRQRVGRKRQQDHQPSEWKWGDEA